MTTPRDPARVCLHVRDWPEADQALWTTALTGGLPEDDDAGRGSAWRPTTIETNRQGYGRWINYLKRSDLDLGADPADRVTPETVLGYRQELEAQDLKPQTRCNRIAELMAVMLAFAPERDWGWLKRRLNRMYALADAERRQKPITIFTGDILDKAFKALDMARRDGVGPRLTDAVEYRNWLMVAMLALSALRRRNFAELSITRHLHRNGDIWMIKIPAAEAKTDKAIVMPVPAVLHRHIDFYLEHVRPTLLRGRISDRLWITWRHTPMVSHSVNVAMIAFTRKVFGVPINPHRFRHIGATSIVMAAPDMMEATRAFLSHGDTQTTKEFYVIGESLTASRQHADLIGKLRRRLPAPSPEPPLVLPACGRDAKLAKGKAA
jgi:site-specific recombinase XerD